MTHLLPFLLPSFLNPPLICFLSCHKSIISISDMALIDAVRTPLFAGGEHGIGKEEQGGQRSHDEQITGQVVHKTDPVRRDTLVEPNDESLEARPLSPTCRGLSYNTSGPGWDWAFHLLPPLLLVYV